MFGFWIVVSGCVSKGANASGCHPTGVAPWLSPLLSAPAALFSMYLAAAQDSSVSEELGVLVAQWSWATLRCYKLCSVELLRYMEGHLHPLIVGGGRHCFWRGLWWCGNATTMTIISGAGTAAHLGFAPRQKSPQDHHGRNGHQSHSQNLSKILTHLKLHFI